jgi:hypothetical protein
VDCQPSFFEPERPSNLSLPELKCQKCPAGTYSGLKASYYVQVPCKTCPQGEIVNPGQTGCIRGLTTTPTPAPTPAPTRSPTLRPTEFRPTVPPTRNPTLSPTPTTSACIIGQYENMALKTCEDCKPGFFSPAPNIPCRKCTFDFQTSKYGSGSCERCQRGAEVNGDRTGCIDCPAGSYYPFPNYEGYMNPNGNYTDTKCLKCEPGTWSTKNTHPFCQKCYDNDYDLNADQTACTLKPR